MPWRTRPIQSQLRRLEGLDRPIIGPNDDKKLCHVNPNPLRDTTMKYASKKNVSVTTRPLV